LSQETMLVVNSVLPSTHKHSTHAVGDTNSGGAQAPHTTVNTAVAARRCSAVTSVAAAGNLACFRPSSVGRGGKELGHLGLAPPEVEHEQGGTRPEDRGERGEEERARAKGAARGLRARRLLGGTPAAGALRRWRLRRRRLLHRRGRRVEQRLRWTSLLGGRWRGGPQHTLDRQN